MYKCVRNGIWALPSWKSTWGEKHNKGRHVKGRQTGWWKMNAGCEDVQFSRMERPLYLSLTLCGLPYSCQALPAPLCGMPAVRTGSGLFVSLLLPVGAECSKERNVRWSESERTTHAHILFVGYQEGAPDGDPFDLDTQICHTHKWMFDLVNGTDGQICDTHTHTHLTQAHTEPHVQNIKDHEIGHLIHTDKLLGFMSHQGTE